MAQDSRGRPSLDPSGEPTTPVSFRLASRKYDTAYAVASQRRVTLSTLVRHALDSYLDQVLKAERGSRP